ncbi:MAG: RidA family protein [Pseudomonadota bacterium]
MAALILAFGLLVQLFAPVSYADEPVYNAPAGRSGPTPYSEAVVYGDLIFLAGHLGRDPETGKLAPGGIQPQTRQALENLQASLERAGGSMDRVLKCTVFLASFDEWAAMNEVYVTFFENKPVRTAVGNAGMGSETRVEIECIAAAPDND